MLCVKIDALQLNCSLHSKSQDEIYTGCSVVAKIRQCEAWLAQAFTRSQQHVHHTSTLMLKEFPESMRCLDTNSCVFVLLLDGRLHKAQKRVERMGLHI